MTSLASDNRPGTRDAFVNYLAMRRSSSAIAALDGLRAFAILLVFARHAIRPFYDGNTPLLPLFGWDLAVPLINGWIGVDLFFVLSGFLIGQSLLRDGGRVRGRQFRLYVAKRALRIVPAYFAVLLVVAAGLVPLFDVDGRALGLRVGYHMLFLQDYLPADIVVVFWSLGVEEKFYLLAPLVVMLALKMHRRSLQYGLIVGFVLLGLVARCLTAAAYPDIATYDAFFPVFRSPFHHCLDALFVGLLAAFIYRDRHCWAWATNRVCLNGLFLLGLSIILWLISGEAMMGRIDYFDKTLQPFVIAIGMGLVLLATALGGGPLTFLGSRPLFYLSKLSYSLYLVHLPLLPLALALLGLPGGDMAAVRGEILLLFFATYAAFSLAASMLVHYGIEKPFLVIKGRLS